jgi:hypothetical protein
VFILEGRLAGQWAKEFLRVTRDIGPNTSCVFDIEEVSYVDQLGEQTLSWLNRLGATFITESLCGIDLCQRLHLHRRIAVNAASVRGRTKQKGRETSPETPHPGTSSQSSP